VALSTLSPQGQTTCFLSEEIEPFLSVTMSCMRQVTETGACHCPVVEFIYKQATQYAVGIVPGKNGKLAIVVMEV